MTFPNDALRKFYDMLNEPAKKNVQDLAAACLSDDWRSFSAEGVSKSKTEFVNQVIGFGKMMPDLRWDVKEILFVSPQSAQADQQFVVRSEAVGTPGAGKFMGVETNGKTFRVMTIDIHTLRAGKLLVAHHVEDWASAIRQISAPVV